MTSRVLTPVRHAIRDFIGTLAPMDLLSPNSGARYLDFQKPIYVVRAETLESYFYDKVQTSTLDGDVKAYLVMTLARWATTEPDLDKPLALEFMEAHQAGGWRYRDVGDKALYLSSMRSHHLRRVVSLRYYEDVGISSYAQFAEHTQSRSFWELAQNFTEASGVIYDVFHEVDTAALVERALQNEDARDVERLSGMGIYLLK